MLNTNHNKHCDEDQKFPTFANKSKLQPNCVVMGHYWESKVDGKFPTTFWEFSGNYWKPLHQQYI